MGVSTVLGRIIDSSKEPMIEQVLGMSHEGHLVIVKLSIEDR
jgi:hypothetical protein